MRIAVVGSGIAGISAAWSLSLMHDVTLFEHADTFGGHSRTLDREVGNDSVTVDTGFIVFNERNYPNLTAFFQELGVDTYDSDMSFAVSTEDRSLEYAGRAGGLFPTVRSLADGRRWRIARGILRFRQEHARLAAGAVPVGDTVKEYLTERGYPDDFLSLYLLPLAAAVWSGTRNNAANMPARTFLSFLDNHGLLTLRDRPQWRTVTGGARAYVDRAVKEITAAHLSRGVVSVTRDEFGVDVLDVHGTTERFDQIVFATHADTTLRILGSDATEAEQRLLSPFAYDRNEVVLHTDANAMPSDRRVWSAWNSVERTHDDGTRPVSVTYWMNKLQSLDTDVDVLVTLNPAGSIDEDRVIDRWMTSHPQFTIDTERAQNEIGSIQGASRSWFAGAYLGHGFHEDGIRSGVAVATALGSPPPWVEAPLDPILEPVGG